MPEFRERGVLPYNTETASDPTHEKKISFRSCGQLFEITLRVPLYIWDALGQADWDFVEKQVRDRADLIRMNAATAGYLTRWTQELNEFARHVAYKQFSKAQFQNGNDSWAAPEGWG